MFLFEAQGVLEARRRDVLGNVHVCLVHVSAVFVKSLAASHDTEKGRFPVQDGAGIHIPVERALERRECHLADAASRLLALRLCSSTLSGNLLIA